MEEGQVSSVHWETAYFCPCPRRLCGMSWRMTKPTPVSLSREKFLQEVNSLTQKPSHPLAKTKTLVKSLMNRAELLLHVTIAAQSGLTRSISGTPAETPGTAPAMA